MKITVLASTLAAGAALVAGMALAAPVHADPGTVTDDNFLAALNNAGITYRDGYQVVAAGQAVCGLMDNGRSGIDVVSDVQKSTPALRWTAPPSSPPLRRNSIVRIISTMPMASD